MKKNLYIVLSIFLLSTVARSIYAVSPTPTPTKGHYCQSSQCITCSIHEDGCLEGECNAFTCNSDDDIAPLKPVITNTDELAQPHSGTSVTIKGYGEANARVHILIDGTDVYQANVGGDNIFNITFNPNISLDGEYKVTVILEDSAGNSSDESEVAALKIDAIKPEITLSEFPGFTSFENFLISGHTEAGCEVILVKDRQEVYKTGADQNGNFDIILPLSDGNNSFTVKSKDGVGNEGTKEISIVFDSSTTNIIELDSREGDTIKLNAPDGIVAVEVYRNGELVDLFQIESQNFTYDISSKKHGLADEFKFIGIDAAGNKTKAFVLRNTNSTGVIVIIIGTILGIGFVGFLGYLIKSGKIVIPKLSKPKSGQQELDIEDEENITPHNLRKEF